MAGLQEAVLFDHGAAEAKSLLECARSLNHVWRKCQGIRVQMDSLAQRCVDDRSKEHVQRNQGLSIGHHPSRGSRRQGNLLKIKVLQQSQMFVTCLSKCPNFSSSKWRHRALQEDRISSGALCALQLGFLTCEDIGARRGSNK